jgi:hypothetical protein
MAERDKQDQQSHRQADAGRFSERFAEFLVDRLGNGRVAHILDAQLREAPLGGRRRVLQRLHTILCSIRVAAHRDVHQDRIMGAFRRVHAGDAGQGREPAPHIGGRPCRGGPVERPRPGADQDALLRRVVHLGVVQPVLGLAGLPHRLVQTGRLASAGGLADREADGDEREPQRDRPPWMSSAPPRRAHGDAPAAAIVVDRMSFMRFSGHRSTLAGRADDHIGPESRARGGLTPPPAGPRCVRMEPWQTRQAGDSPISAGR